MLQGHSHQRSPALSGGGGRRGSGAGEGGGRGDGGKLERARARIQDLETTVDELEDALAEHEDGDGSEGGEEREALREQLARQGAQMQELDSLIQVGSKVWIKDCKM